MSSESIQNSQSLLNAKDVGVLSTLSLKLGGFPFGSIVPYCLDGDSMPVVLISTIAEHTKNIINDKRCSLTIVMDGDDAQANGRLCIIGNMERVEKEETEVMERYYRHFPKSRSYDAVHSFSFYRLAPISIRYIGGFGKIHWFTPEEFLPNNPFHGKGEERIIQHMNNDHRADLGRYCAFYKEMRIAADDTIRMVGIDSIGFDIFVNDKKVRLDFEKAISSAVEAREALVALSKGVK